MLQCLLRGIEALIQANLYFWYKMTVLSRYNFYEKKKGAF